MPNPPEPTDERLNREFLAILSHELRTPLNAILGWTTILLRTAAGTPFEKGLKIIERNARAQTRLIEDLLDMSRMIGGRLALNLRDVDLRPTIEAAVESLRPTADAAQVTISVRPAAEPLIVHGDAARLQQIALNLLSNAVKFTPAGGSVTVELGREDSDVVFAVRDTGIGIAADLLPRIFDRFQQAVTSGERAHGLGLGLAIVRDLVKLHGGSVSAESAGEGQGTTVTVRLPASDTTNDTMDTKERP